MLSFFKHLWNKLAKQATRSPLVRSSTRKDQVRLGLEILEDRQTPSITLSGTTLNVQCDTVSEQQGQNTITLSVDNNTGGVIASILDSQGNLEQQTFNKGAVKQIQASGSIFGNDTFDVLETHSGVQTNISEANGPAVINISQSQGLDFIRGKVDVHGNLGGLTLNIYDQGGGADTYTVSASQVTRNGPVAAIKYDDVSNLNLFGGTLGGETYKVKNTEGLAGTPITTTLNTGQGPSTVNVLGTTGQLDVVGDGPLKVNLGNQGSVQGIIGGVGVANPNFTAKVDDHADSHPRTVSVTNDVGFLSSEFIQGLAPGTLGFLDAGTNQVNIKTGTGSNTVNILSTGVPTSLVSHGPDAVNIGFSAGSVQNILGALAISNVGSKSSINIDDHLDPSTQNATLSHATLGSSPWGSLSGLASASITYKYASTARLNIETNNTSTVDVASDGGVKNTFVNGQRE